MAAMVPAEDLPENKPVITSYNQFSTEERGDPRPIPG